MVIDKIENYSLYVITERMAKGFEFINNHLATMEPGVYEIESKSILRLFKSTIQRK
jgi:beta-galactosidase beta subunit